jgi:hypothetical protein
MHDYIIIPAPRDLLDMRHLYATGDIHHVSDATDQIPDSATAMRGRRGLDRLVV